MRRMRSTVTLRVAAGPLRGSVFTFDRHAIRVFGRAHDCNVHLPDDDLSASRYHFILEADPPEARLHDLGSSNGTIVNGVRYGGRAQEGLGDAADGPADVALEDGDVVEAGQTVLRVEVETRAPGSGGAAYTDGRPLADAPGSGGGLSAYERLGRIGEGGMGIVYRARHRETGETVAIKEIRARLGTDKRALAIFRREIDVTRSLAHPAIVRLIDHGMEDGKLYFVMEYCEGGSVRSLVEERGGKLPPAEACGIVLQVLDGLSYAHARGFVHRDIKPENILLTGRGMARLSDFGLGKNFLLAGLSGLTVTGARGGTFAYMSRDQLLDFKYTRPASDVWSLGATLYHLLTGSVPRSVGKNRPFADILEREVMPIRSRDPGVPPGIAAVVDRAVTDDVAQRYQDASQLREALASVARVPAARRS